MRVARVESSGGMARALRELGFDQSLPTLVVVGGADGLAAADHERLAPLIENLAALAERRGAAVVDGGTDVGVMQLLGRARARGLTCRAACRAPRRAGVARAKPQPCAPCSRCRMG